jgi:plastocyanin
MAFIDEFIPRTIRAKVNEKVTWTFVGPHTVSFNVPPYLPQFIISDDGTVTFNPQAYQPVDSPPVPTFQEGAPPPDIDGGRWDGSSFISSGLLGEGTYSLTFTKAGRYRYACLVHPRMVGEVVVS